MDATVTDGKVSDRRSFLKGAAAGAAAVVATVAVPSQAKAARSPQLGMLIDTRRCTGCHGCSVSCKAEFDVPLGVTRSWVEYVEKGDFPNVSVNFLPRLCNQCRHPICVDVCPTGATYKRDEDGVVVIDPEICIGCKYCIQACPYNARFMNHVTGAADKCDFCQHRVSQGLVPACVEACIGNARIFGDLNDPDSEIARMAFSNPTTVLRAEQGTEPNVLYIAADHSDEHERKRGRHVEVTTHRKQQERR